LAANVDLLVAVLSLARPEFNPRLLDRFLALADHFEVEALVCVNKRDLDGQLPPEAEYAQSMGYQLAFCSAKQGDGLPELKALLRGKHAVLAGPSGAGKSTLIRALVPGADPKIGVVRDGDGKGRHTTTAGRLYASEDGIRLIDTPGIRELGFWGLDSENLVFLWRDFRPYLGACRFRNCAHGPGEEGCAILEAVVAGSIPVFRYESFLRVRETLEE
jgi:ribosome biogenesis GTPase